jgi:acyl-CoA thioesterase-1
MTGMVRYPEMRRSFRMLFVSVLAAGYGTMLGGCDASSRDAAEGGSLQGEPRPDAVGSSEQESRPRIVALGDSLTAGFGVAADESYPAQLQRRLDELGYRYRVINAGVSGDTSAGALRRVEWVLKANPTVVIVEIGANDGLRGLDPNETRANIDAIVERLQRAGATVVLTGMKMPPNYGADYTRRFGAIYPEVARRHGIAYMPFFLEGVGGNATLNLPDGIHPTAAGYRRVVSELLPVLEPILRKPERG